MLWMQAGCCSFSLPPSLKVAGRAAFLGAGGCTGGHGWHGRGRWAGCSCCGGQGAAAAEIGIGCSRLPMNGEEAKGSWASGSHGLPCSSLAQALAQPRLRGLGRVQAAASSVAEGPGRPGAGRANVKWYFSDSADNNPSLGRTNPVPLFRVGLRRIRQVVMHLGSRLQRHEGPCGARRPDDQQ